MSALRWYEEGFALGAAGATPKRRKGRPRLKRMLMHWREGIEAGRFALSAFRGAYKETLARGRA